MERTELELGVSGLKDLLSLDKALNDNFVLKIINLNLDEVNIRKAVLDRLNINSGDYLSKENMSKTFLRAFSKAFNHLYGCNQYKGV